MKFSIPETTRFTIGQAYEKRGIRKKVASL